MIKLHYYKKLVIVCWLLFLISGCLNKPQPKTGDFNGIVIDYYTKEPVPGVVVSLNGNQVTTDMEGKFIITILPPGEYEISMARQWYFPTIQQIKHVGRSDLWTFEIRSEPINGKILYSGNRDGDREIYAINLTDKSVSKLIDWRGSNETNPCLKANSLVFQSNRNNNIEEFFSYDYVKEPKELSFCSGNKCEHPSFDQSGITMVYKSDSNIWWRDTSNTNNTITFPTGYNPVISKDGKKIAYVNGTYQTLRICIDEFNFKEISFGGNIKINNPAWNPSGDCIALESYTDGNGPRAIYLVYIDNLNTSKLQQLTFPQRLNEKHHHPCWSGDGSLLFFSGNIIYSSREDIYCISVNEALTMKENAKWVMVSKESGDKNYPCWSE